MNSNVHWAGKINTFIWLTFILTHNFSLTLCQHFLTEVYMKQPTYHWYTVILTTPHTVNTSRSKQPKMMVEALSLQLKSKQPFNNNLGLWRILDNIKWMTYIMLGNSHGHGTNCTIPVQLEYICNGMVLRIYFYAFLPTAKDTDVSYEDLMVFMTGADTIPTLGFPSKPTIDFFDQEAGVRRLPYSSTCSLHLFLPRGVSSEEEMTDLISTAVKCGMGFGKP